MEISGPNDKYITDEDALEHIERLCERFESSPEFRAYAPDEGRQQAILAQNVGRLSAPRRDFDSSQIRLVDTPFAQEPDRSGKTKNRKKNTRKMQKKSRRKNR